MKRFSKMCSSRWLTPSARVSSAIICACRSVGKPGKGAVATSTAPDVAVLAADLQPAVGGGDLDAGLLELVGEGADQLAPAADQLDLAAGDRRGEHVGAELDPVGDHRMRRAVQPLDAADLDRRRCPRRRSARPSGAGTAARSTISGSRAAFFSTVVPRASVAAISTFSVAPTETSGNSKTAPFSPEGAVAWT